MNQHQGVAMAWYGAFDHDQAALVIHFHYTEVAGGNFGIAMLTSHFHAFEDAGRLGTLTDGTRTPE
jgi:hypothetical protein